MIRGIIFDCFGVLYGGSLEAFIAMCPLEKVQELRDLNRQSDYGFITGKEYVDGIAEILEISSDQVRDIMQQRHIRNQPLIDFSQTLRDKYQLGMLSNVSSDTMDHLFSPDERKELFDTVLLSYEDHIVKPNPEVFRLMAERMNLKPEECVMIDDLEENCEGAEIAGMQSIRHITNELTIKTLDAMLAE